MKDIRLTITFFRAIALLCLWANYQQIGWSQWVQSGNIVASFYNSALAWDGKIYFAGGIPTIATGNNQMQILDLETNQITSKNLSAGRGGMMAIAHKGKLYFAGGYKWINNGAAYQMFSVVDVYNTATETFEATLQLSAPRGAGVAAILGDSLLFAGGYSYQSGILFHSDIVEIYDTKSGEWKAPAQLSVRRGDLGAATVNGKVYFCGGATNLQTGKSSNIVDIFDGTNWTTDTLSAPRSSMAVVAVGKYLIVAGGGNDEVFKFDLVDILDTETGQWEHEVLSAPRCFVAAAVSGNKAYFTGGGNCNAATFFLDESSKIVDVFDAVTGEFSQIESLNTNRIAHACAAWEDKIVVGGGWRPEQNSFTGSVEVYTDVDWVSNAGNARDDFDFRVFPNPATDGINVWFKSNASTFSDSELRLVNLSGKVCFRAVLNEAEQQFMVGHLAAGMYLLEVRNGENLVKEKLGIIR